MTKIPILVIAFNRPDVTRMLVERIKSARPEKVYIACDGYRDSVEGEEGKVSEVRQIAESLQSVCEIECLYQEKNIGCKAGVVAALNWFFSFEERGIILEDDCLPSTSFFRYCECLLKKYEDDMRVWHIGGTTFREYRKEESYRFTAYAGVWGWATWRNRWLYYEESMNDYKTLEWRHAVKRYDLAQSFWNKNLDKVATKKIDTWDYQWLYTMWINRGLAIAPNTNLISNMGFGNNATHTTDGYSHLAALKISEIGALKHPKSVKRDKRSDGYMKGKYFSSSPLWLRVVMKIAVIGRKIKGHL